MHSPAAIHRPAPPRGPRHRATQAVRTRDCSRRGGTVPVATSAIASPRSLNTLRFLGLGAVLVCVGGVGDIAYHLLPFALAASLEPVVGVEAIRAHLVTLAGMLLMVAALIGRGLRH
jgi:hypothetical protein